MSDFAGALGSAVTLQGSRAVLCWLMAAGSRVRAAPPIGSSLLAGVLVGTGPLGDEHAETVEDAVKAEVQGLVR